MAKRGVVNRKQSRDEEERPVRWRKYAHIFLIVCEDSNTEPYYFERFQDAFPEETFFLKAVGTGRSTKGVVERAIEERNALYEEANKKVDEVWAVFDKDDADKKPGTLRNFQEAFELADENEIHIGYSNEAFELWLLLHYQDVDHTTAIARQELNTMLEAAIKRHRAFRDFIYKHGDNSVIDALFKTGDEAKAIKRAERVFEAHGKTKPINANPSTKVFLLVRRLRQLAVYYNYTPPT